MDNIIDTHCHYNLSPLVDSWSTHWQKSQAQGVSTSIVVGTDVSSSRVASEIISDEPNLYQTVGIHPVKVAFKTASARKILVDNEYQQLKELLWQLKMTRDKVVAVGEIGLDYYRLDPTKSDAQEVRLLQHHVFQLQLSLAVEHQLPVVLHIRDKGSQAYQESLEFLRKFDLAGIVLHCFSGSTEFQQAVSEMGGFFGIDGHITYPSNSDLRDQLLSLPQNKILLETDAPYLPPQQYRGKTCEPWMISLTAQYLQSELNLDIAQITANAQQAFPLLT